MKPSKIKEQIEQLQIHADKYESKQGNTNSLWHDRIKVLQGQVKKPKETRRSVSEE